MAPMGFEPMISAGERPETYALDRAATGTGVSAIWQAVFYLYIGSHRRKAMSPFSEEICKQKANTPTEYIATGFQSRAFLPCYRSVLGLLTIL